MNERIFPPDALIGGHISRAVTAYRTQVPDELAAPLDEFKEVFDAWRTGETELRVTATRLAQPDIRVAEFHITDGKGGPILGFKARSHRVYDININDVLKRDTPTDELIHDALGEVRKFNRPNSRPGFKPSTSIRVGLVGATPYSWKDQKRIQPVHNVNIGLLWATTRANEGFIRVIGKTQPRERDGREEITVTPPPSLVDFARMRATIHDTTRKYHKK